MMPENGEGCVDAVAPCGRGSKRRGMGRWNGRCRLGDRVAPPYTWVDGTPPPLPAHPDVLIEADERVWDGRFPLDRIRFRHRRFDGTLSGPRTWEFWRRGRAAAMLPYDPVEDAVVLIEQFRLPALAAGLDPVMVEVPAGSVRRRRIRRGDDPPRDARGDGADRRAA